VLSVLAVAMTRVRPFTSEQGARSIRYLLVPHPDDEAQSWSLVEDRSIYPVFILLTHGEATRQCRPEQLMSSLQTGEGEVAPPTMPTAPRSPSCAEARLGSWHRFFSDVASWDDRFKRSEAQGPRQLDSPCPACSRQAYDLWLGAGSARLIFDFGDRDLTIEEVRAALDEARLLASRGTFGDRDEDGVVGAAYASEELGCAFYDHPDHVTVHSALRDGDLAVGHRMWTRTSSCVEGARPFTLTDDAYRRLFAGDHGDPGLVSRVYGWLAVGTWPVGPDDRVRPGRSADPFDPHGTPFFTQSQPHLTRLPD
jgi:hypothetical protein